MIAQIFASIIFIAMFVFIVTEIIERHIVSLVCALLTLLLVFGLGMHSLSAIIDTINLHSIISPAFSDGAAIIAWKLKHLSTYLF